MFKVNGNRAYFFFFFTSKNKNNNFRKYKNINFHFK